MNNLKILLLLIALSVVVFRGALIGHRYQTGDSINARSVGAVLEKEVLPEWNPYIFSGMPTIGSMQYAVALYPFNWLRVTGTSTFSIHVLHIILAAIGFILYVRKKFKMDIWLAVAGAISFAFSLQIIGFEIYGQGSKAMSICYLPWLFWSIERLNDNRDLTTTAVLALILGLQLLRGHFQMAYYSWLFAIPYAIYVFNDSPYRKELYGRSALSFFCGGIISAVLVLPVLNYASISTRVGGIGLDKAVGIWSIGFGELFTLAMPTLYGHGSEYVGSLAILEFPFYAGAFVCLGALFSLKLKSVRFHGIAVVVCCLVALGEHTPLYGLLYDLLPGFSRFRAPASIFGIAQFFISVMFVVGLKKLYEKALPLKWAYLIAIVGACVVIGWPYLPWPENLNVADNLFFVVMSFLALWLCAKHKNVYWPVAVVIVDILIAMSSMPSAENVELVSEDGVHELLKQDEGVYRVFMVPPLTSEIAAYGVELINGYHAAKPKDYQTFIEQTKNFTSFNDKMLLHLNIKYLVSIAPQKNAGDLVGKTWTWHAGQKVDVHVYRSDYYAERVCDNAFKPVGKYTRVSMDEFRVDEIDSVESIFISERCVYGWECTVENGKKLEIDKNGLCMKVDVPQGVSSLVFEYHTPMLGEGFLFSCLGMSLPLFAFGQWLYRWVPLFLSALAKKINVAER